MIIYALESFVEVFLRTSLQKLGNICVVVLMMAGIGDNLVHVH